jgi:hypothetical protein
VALPSLDSRAERPYIDDEHRYVDAERRYGDDGWRDGADLARVRADLCPDDGDGVRFDATLWRNLRDE